MDDLFNLLRMENWDNYEKRKVLSYEKDNLIVDTCEVHDQPNPYNFETAISHKGYRDGEWIIVEIYEIEANAILGHNKWVKIMTSDNLPEQLTDVSKIPVCKLKDRSEKGWRVFKKQSKVD